MLVNIINPVFHNHYVLSADVYSPETHEIMFKAGEQITWEVILSMYAIGLEKVQVLDDSKQFELAL
jgi:hypothetical protein